MNHKYVVIESNGHYSERTVSVRVVCDTEEQAKKAVSLFESIQAKCIEAKKVDHAGSYYNERKDSLPQQPDARMTRSQFIQSRIENETKPQFEAAWQKYCNDWIKENGPASHCAHAAEVKLRYEADDYGALKYKQAIHDSFTQEERDFGSKYEPVIEACYDASDYSYYEVPTY